MSPLCLSLYHTLLHHCRFRFGNSCDDGSNALGERISDKLGVEVVRGLNADQGLGCGGNNSVVNGGGSVLDNRG